MPVPRLFVAVAVLASSLGSSTAKPPESCFPDHTPPDARGRADADRDFAEGDVGLRIYDTRTTAVQETRAELLQRRYGMKHRRFDGEPSADQQTYTDAYNTRVWTQLVAVNGKDLRADLTAEAALLGEIRSMMAQDADTTVTATAARAADRDFTATRQRLIMVGHVSGIDSVYHELLLRRFKVSSPVLKDPGRDVRRFVAAYNERMTQRLIEAHGERWRRARREAADEAAERDIDAGRLRITVFGMPDPSDIAYHQLLQEQLGVEVLLGGCILPVNDLKVYDRRMREEIERRFGAGILKDIRDQAAEWLDRRGDGWEPCS
jgi:hypothetical protein